MLKIMGKKIFTILRIFFCLSKPVSKTLAMLDASAWAVIGGCLRICFKYQNLTYWPIYFEFEFYRPVDM